jgi:hypothetical protein
MSIRYVSRRWRFSALLVSTVAGFTCDVACLHVVAQVIVREITSEPVGSIPGVIYFRFGILGAVCGLVFWLIARPELRPDASLERTRDR